MGGQRVGHMGVLADVGTLEGTLIVIVSGYCYCEDNGRYMTLFCTRSGRKENHRPPAGHSAWMMAVWRSRGLDWSHHLYCTSDNNLGNGCTYVSTSYYTSFLSVNPSGLLASIGLLC